MKQKIEFSKESVSRLSEMFAIETLKRIDFGKLKKEIASSVRTPEDGRDGLDGKDLLMTQALRADVVNAVSRLVPAGRDGEVGKDGSQGESGRDGNDYILTDTDRIDIADKVKIPDVDMTAIIDSIREKALFVTRETFRRELLVVRDKLNARTQNAGISGDEMIQEIEKAFQAKIVRTEGDQVIDGVKTFLSGLRIDSIGDSGDDPYIRFSGVGNLSYWAGLNTTSDVIEVSSGTGAYEDRTVIMSIDAFGNLSVFSNLIVTGVAVKGIRNKTMSNPPTLAELTAALGPPYAWSAGSEILINNNSGLNQYTVISDGASFWIHAGIKAV